MGSKFNPIPFLVKERENYLKGDNNMNNEQEQTAIPQEDRQQCEVWTRVMGYHRPVSSFNTGKQSEYAERKFFKEGCCNQE